MILITFQLQIRGRLEKQYYFNYYSIVKSQFDTFWQYLSASAGNAQLEHVIILFSSSVEESLQIGTVITLSEWAMWGNKIPRLEYSEISLKYVFSSWQHTICIRSNDANRIIDFFPIYSSQKNMQLTCDSPIWLFVVVGILFTFAWYEEKIAHGQNIWSNNKEEINLKFRYEIFFGFFCCC